MNITATPREQAFKQEFCAWLEGNLPDAWKVAPSRNLSEAERWAISKQWGQTLGKAGYLGIGWPKAYGGRDATYMERAIYYSELRFHDAPTLPDPGGLSLIGPTLMELGTDEQREEHLGRIIRGETIWVQAFSEPNAGSDLASLQTRADLDGDEWVINGHKLWSSRGHHADWCFCLARTDQDAPKHKGISMFLFPMTTPGISLHPYKDMTGETHWSEMYFDNVRVPRSSIVGEVNTGWLAAQRLLTYERGLFTISIVADWELFWEDLRSYATATSRGGRLLIDREDVRLKLASLYTHTRMMRMMNYRYITAYERGKKPAEETSLLKLTWSKFGQELSDLALELCGPDGLRMPGAHGAVAKGDWAWRELRTRSDTIYGGTQDIQRNIIAERMLGLPR